MTQHTNTGAAQAVPTTDARAWLAAWADHGGIAMLCGDRLYVSRSAGLDRSAMQSLDRLRPWIMQPGGGEALASVLVGLAGLWSGDVSGRARPSSSFPQRELPGTQTWL